MRKDVLAAGAPKATFSGGFGEGELRSPLALVEPETYEPPLPAHVDNLASFHTEAPVPTYKGRPLGDMVLVQRVEKKSNSKIILADTARGKSDMGKVISVGSKVTELSAGRLVLFDKYAAVGNEVELIGEDGRESLYLLVQECDILLILEEVNDGQIVAT